MNRRQPRIVQSHFSTDQKPRLSRNGQPTSPHDGSLLNDDGQKSAWEKYLERPETVQQMLRDLCANLGLDGNSLSPLPS